MYLQQGYLHANTWPLPKQHLLCNLYKSMVNYIVLCMHYTFCVYHMIFVYLVDLFNVHVASWQFSFLQVRKGLVPLIQEIKQKGTKPDSSLLAGSFDTKAQAALCNAIAVDMGFSLEQGRLDVSVHPFTGGNAMQHTMMSMA